LGLTTAACLAPGTKAILPPGAIIDPEIFFREVNELKLAPERVMISHHATVMSDEDRRVERSEGLVDRIGSTVGDTGGLMRDALKSNRVIVIEGSQGFGLSLLHGGYYPNATSRDTTAATFVGEAGLSPRDVKDITLVLRAHPIRVAGNSGPLKGETSWSEIAKAAGLPPDYCELTTATKKVRRVGTFDAGLVQRAIEVNNPTRIVLNHFDCVDAKVRTGKFHPRALEFLKWIESSINRTIDWIGTGPGTFLDRSEIKRFEIGTKLETSEAVPR
jgi:adenylosuccinate synthase